MLNNKETPESEGGATRRRFLGKALAAGAGIALGAALPQSGETVEAQTAPVCAASGQTLVPIAEIKKTTANGPVQGIIKILNESKTYVSGSKTGGPPVCNSGQMRYFAGSLPNGPQLWPPKNGSPAPGPTLRARVGDTVEITLLNQVDVTAFGNSLDTGEHGEGCDMVTSVTAGGSLNTYPGDPPFDSMPNCYHGSSTANLHYHGTHLSPNVIEDNVFVQLRPSPRVKGEAVVNEAFLRKNDFGRIFDNCQSGHSPTKWQDLPPNWQKAQEGLLKQYDQTAVWQGVKGGMPAAERLWPKIASISPLAAGRNTTLVRTLPASN